MDNVVAHSDIFRAVQPESWQSWLAEKEISVIPQIETFALLRIHDQTSVLERVAVEQLVPCAMSRATAS
jgi:hypothetical protein